MLRGLSAIWLWLQLWHRLEVWVKIETLLSTHSDVKFQPLLIVTVPTVSGVYKDRMRSINGFIIFHFWKFVVCRGTIKLGCTKRISLAYGRRDFLENGQWDALKLMKSTDGQREKKQCRIKAVTSYCRNQKERYWIETRRLYTILLTEIFLCKIQIQKHKDSDSQLIYTFIASATSLKQW